MSTAAPAATGAAVTDVTPSTLARALRLAPQWPWIAFALAAALSLAGFLYLGRDLLFYLDEWDWIVHRRDPSVDAWLEPHVGHLSVVPVLVYEAFLWVFGIDDYTPFRVLVLTLHVGVVTLAFAWLRRRLAPEVALVGAVVLLFFGAAWQDLLWAFQIGFVLAVGFGVAAFLLVERDRRGADRGAAACVLLALGSASIGLPVTAGLAVWIAWRREWRRWWVVGVPALAYAAWYAAYGESFAQGREDWPDAGDVGPVDVVRYSIEAAGSTVGALVGVGSTVGQVLLVPLAVVVLLTLRRADRARRARVLALAAVPAAFWVSLGISRFGIQPPGTSRYLYPGAVFVVLLLGECARHTAVPRLALAALVVAGGWSVVWNVQEAVEGRDDLLVDANGTRAELGGIQLGARGLDAAYDATRPPLPPDVVDWVAAFDDLGFPGSTAGQLLDRPPEDRRRADAFLVHAAGIELGDPPTATGPAPAVTRGGPAAPDGEGCVLLRSAGGPVDAEVSVGTPALRIEAVGAPVALRLRLLSDDFFTGDAAWATVRSGTTAGVRVPTVDGGPSWSVGLRTPAAARVCGAGDPVGRAGP